MRTLSFFRVLLEISFRFQHAVVQPRQGRTLSRLATRKKPAETRRSGCWLALARRRLGLRQSKHQLGRRQRGLVEFDAEAPQGIVHRIEDGGRRRDGAAFADALDAIIGVRRRGFDVVDGMRGMSVAPGII